MVIRSTMSLVICMIHLRGAEGTEVLAGAQVVLNSVITLSLNKRQLTNRESSGLLQSTNLVPQLEIFGCGGGFWHHVARCGCKIGRLEGRVVLQKEGLSASFYLERSKIANSEGPQETTCAQRASLQFCISRMWNMVLSEHTFHEF